MAETYEMQDILVSNSGVAKSMPGRAQALPNACCALPPMQFAKDGDTLTEQTKYPLKQSVLCKFNIVTPAL